MLEIIKSSFYESYAYVPAYHYITLPEKEFSKKDLYIILHELGHSVLHKNIRPLDSMERLLDPQLLYEIEGDAWLYAYFCINKKGKGELLNLIRSCGPNILRYFKENLLKYDTVEELKNKDKIKRLELERPLRR